jgi:hypothetical protein
VSCGYNDKKGSDKPPKSEFGFTDFGFMHVDPLLVHDVDESMEMLHAIITW